MRKTRAKVLRSQFETLFSSQIEKGRDSAEYKFLWRRFKKIVSNKSIKVVG